MYLDNVLVVDRTELEKFTTWKQGFETNNLFEIYQKIKDRAYFAPWSQVEENDDLVQVVGCVVMQRSDRLWVMERKPEITDQRLQEHKTLCVTDHIFKPEEDKVKDVIVNNIKYMWHNSVWSENSYQANLISMLWDRDDVVGKHHLGLVFIVGVKRGLPGLRTEDYFDGKFIKLKTVLENYEKYDSWSKMLLKSLMSDNETIFPSTAHVKFLANQLPE